MSKEDKFVDISSNNNTLNNIMNDKSNINYIKHEHLTYDKVVNNADYYPDSDDYVEKVGNAANYDNNISKNQKQKCTIEPHSKNRNRIKKLVSNLKNNSFI